MARDFDGRVCEHFGTGLAPRGFVRLDGCTFGLLSEDFTRSVILQEGTSRLSGQFMPRLAVSLRSLGDVAVLWTSLHQLVAPHMYSDWYDNEEGLGQAWADLVDKGLPWLESFNSLHAIGDALERQVQPAPPHVDKSFWRRLVASPEPEVRPNSNAIRYLSHCREQQGDYNDALRWWQRYISTCDRLDPASDLANQLNARLLELQAKVAHDQNL